MLNERGTRVARFPLRGPQPPSRFRTVLDSEISDDDIDSDPGSDSVRSIVSPADDVYDPSDIGRGNISEDYGDDLHEDLLHRVTGSSGSTGSSAGRRSRSSPPASPAQLAARLRDLGLADSELSEAPDFMGETDEDTQQSESDEDVSNINSTEDLDYEEELYDEVPNPPELPAVAEERLQETWPLGDASFSIFLCPITHDVMTDPVVSADGYTYERSAIARWFDTSRKSPVTGQSLPHTDLVPNQSVRTLLKTLIDMTVSSESTQQARACAETTQAKRQPQFPAATKTASLTASADTAAVSSTDHVEAALPAQLDAAQSSSQPRRDSEVLGEARSELRRDREPLSGRRERDPRDPLHAGRLSGRRSQGHIQAQVAATASLQPSAPSMPQRPLSSSLSNQSHRTASQAQHHTSHTSHHSSGSQSRPLSSGSSCPQQQPQAPSTALPPLRPGQALAQDRDDLRAGDFHMDWRPQHRWDRSTSERNRLMAAEGCPH